MVIYSMTISGCSNLARVNFDNQQKTEYNDLELAQLIRNIQSDNVHPNSLYKLDRYTPLTLSPGDRLVVNIADDETFDGIYEINIDGLLSLPYVDPILVVGKTVRQVEGDLRHHLIQQKILKPNNALVSCQIQQWSAIKVLVSGSVFSPGGVTINHRSVEQKNYMQTQKNGDSSFERFLTTAIRSAGGVRPDADLGNIKVIRNGVVSHADISGVLTGMAYDDVPLVAGDQIIIPSLGIAQMELMRPSQITPPGFDIFISNLSTPADTNGKAGIGKHARSIPFGTRLLRGLISANCVGGTQSTSASRVAILVTTDLTTGSTKVIQRSIEELVRNHNRDEFNPYLMPNDGIACYDSNVTNMRAVARTIRDLFDPVSLLLNMGED
jgi:polysaccharide export outer membrane protein